VAQILMQKSRLIQLATVFLVCTTLGLLLVLWRLGVAPVCGGLIGLNMATVLLHGYDKRQAVIGRTRVPEAALHVVALFGGSPGALLAQILFRHKTRKRYFRVVFAAIVLLQIAVIYGYWRFVRN
jgi:uncharacterized membrane protein YsdA (DUF1294 family)